MTAFDIVALLVLLVSGLIGYARGAVREVVTLVAFGAAAFAALAVLRPASALAHHVVHPDWAAAATALLVVFVLVYVGVRVGGGWLARQLHAMKLGPFDRAVGAGFGVVRALVALGLAFLTVQALSQAVPPPRWIVGAASWPLARASGRELAALAPKGAAVREGLDRLFADNVRPSFGLGSNITAADQAAPGVQLGGGASPNATAPRESAAERHRGLQVNLTGAHARHRHEAAP